jgi:hypothetical protein
MWISYPQPYPHNIRTLVDNCCGVLTFEHKNSPYKGLSFAFLVFGENKKTASRFSSAWRLNDQ